MKFPMSALSALALILSVGAACAQPMDTPAANATAPNPAATEAPSVQPTSSLSAAASPCCTLAANTFVEIEISETLNSSVQKQGDKFKLRLAEPVMQDGVQVLPSGVEGVGEIIDAGPSRGGGAPGKLIVAARYLDYNGMRIPLHGMKLSGAGKGTVGASVAAGLVIGPFAMFIKGHNIEFPVGTRAQAKLGASVTLPPTPSHPVPSGSPAATPASSAPAATTTTSTTSSQE